MPKRKFNSQIPLFLLIGGGLLLLVAAILLGLQNTSTPPTPDSLSHEDTYPEIPRVSLEDAKAAFDAGIAVFVDVRSADAYQDSHIAGSVNIPLAELELRFNELDPAQWIITYCT